MCVCFCKSCSTMLNELCSLTMHSWCVLIRDHLTCIYDAGCITCICENCNNSFFILRVLPVIYIHIYIYPSVNVIFLDAIPPRCSSVILIDSSVIFIYAFLFLFSGQSFRLFMGPASSELLTLF